MQLILHVSLSQYTMYQTCFKIQQSGPWYKTRRLLKTQLQTCHESKEEESPEAAGTGWCYKAFPLILTSSKHMSARNMECCVYAKVCWTSCFREVSTNIRVFIALLFQGDQELFICISVVVFPCCQSAEIVVHSCGYLCSPTKSHWHVLGVLEFFY